MSLRTQLLFATLFAVAALATPGSYKAEPGSYKAESDLPNPTILLRAPAPAAAALPRKVELPSELLPASFLLAQSKDPKDLGVGKLLVAARGVGDPRFAKTVILLVTSDEGGVIGLVLNRRTTVPLSQVLDLKAAKDRSDPVYLGGPVGPSIAFALFQPPAALKSKFKKAKNIFDNVYLITSKDLFEKTIAARPDPDIFHVYMGYAGWTEAQLQAEVQLGVWFIFPADPATVFNSDPESLWLHMIQKTELRLAKTEPFGEISQPAEVF